MGDREALYRAVIENPADDAPRLVFADWLEEHGEPERAEFIRVQIELAKRTWENPDFHRLHARAERLARGKKLLWKESLPQLRGVSWDDFWRGFVGGARFVNFDCFRAHIKEVVSVAPITRVCFVPSSPVASLNALACTPHMARITTLDLEWQSLTNAAFVHLTKAKYLSALQHLSLRHNDLTEANVRRLAESRAFPNLQMLDLSGNPNIGPAAVEVLISSRWLRKLKQLKIDDEPLGPEAAEELKSAFGERVVFPHYRR